MNQTRIHILFLFSMMITLMIFLGGKDVFAENIDPDNDDSQYAYGENVGWLNFEPDGDGGPGVEVGDSKLTGYIWAENIGWVSLSCENTSSCGTVDFGVTIDPVTGEFSGYAWGENIGWITLRSTGPVLFGVTTSWAVSISDPLPDIKANGSDGPVSIIPIDDVDITVSLDPGSFSGEKCDWWIGALTPFGNFWLSPWGWIKYDWPIMLFQWPLFEFSGLSVLDTPLPVGIYIFFFILDNNPNGLFDEMTWYDYVNVNCQSEGVQMEALPDFDALFQEKIKELMRE